jgi:hypothetical protein
MYGEIAHEDVVALDQDLTVCVDLGLGVGQDLADGARLAVPY